MVKNFMAKYNMPIATPLRKMPKIPPEGRGF